MCVAQFNEYCKASRFKVDEKGSFEKDCRDENIEIRGGSYTNYIDGIPYSVYYTTDLKKIRHLAKLGNKYAIEHLQKL